MKSNVTKPRQVEEAKETARHVASNEWMIGLARLGYATKGVVYLIIGSLAVALAAGHGGKATDQRGALQTIAVQPFGKFLLIVVAIGLLGYALWSFIQMVFDPDREGHDAKGMGARLGVAFGGVAYVGLAIGAFQLALGSGTAGNSSTTSTQDWTAHLLRLHPPLGVALVVLVGLIVLGVAVALYARAYKAQFQRQLNLAGMSAQLRKAAIFMGRFGYAALGMVFTIIGLFLIVAALQQNPAQAKGLDTALTELLHQPFGPVLLGIVALGLLAYGVFSFVEAGYRHISA
jgi:MFS family permease